MNLEIRKITFLMLATFFLEVHVHSEEPVFDTGRDPAAFNEPKDSFDHFKDSVKLLKGKTIPQAYFVLSSPQVPGNPIFAPDAKGGSFMLISRILRSLPEGKITKESFTEWKKNYQGAGTPIWDARNSEILIYSDDSWTNFQKAMEPWIFTEKEIVGTRILQWYPTDLVVKIPRENEDQFFRVLLKAWRTDELSFRCFVGWN